MGAGAVATAGATDVGADEKSSGARESTDSAVAGAAAGTAAGTATSVRLKAAEVGAATAEGSSASADGAETAVGSGAATDGAAIGGIPTSARCAAIGTDAAAAMAASAAAVAASAAVAAASAAAMAASAAAMAASAASSALPLVKVATDVMGGSSTLPADAVASITSARAAGGDGSTAVPIPPPPRRDGRQADNPRRERRRTAAAAGSRTPRRGRCRRSPLRPRCHGWALLQATAGAQVGAAERAQRGGREKGGQGNGAISRGKSHREWQ